MPLVGDMRALHQDVPVGSEAQEYIEERKRLAHELGKINHAKEGIIRAFSITDAELEYYKNEPARRDAAAIATKFSASWKVRKGRKGGWCDAMRFDLI